MNAVIPTIIILIINKGYFKHVLPAKRLKISIVCIYKIYIRMPKSYTKAQKKAYAKKMRAERAKKKAPVKKVIKQNQFRVEYKDRISPVVVHSLFYDDSGATTNTVSGPANSLIMVPAALTKLFSTGTLNGEIDGNSFNPRYLNMKLKVDFSKLKNTGTQSAIVKYDIQIYQGLILQDLREYLDASHVNSSSGRTQPAFSDATTAPGHWTQIAKKFLYNSHIKADFLTYEKKMDTQVRILKKWRVMGDQDSNLVLQSGGDTAHLNQTPDKHYTFNWKMPKNKQTLSPALTTSTVAGVTPSSMFVPFVMITLHQSVATTAADSLQVSEISHFTYTDS